MTRGVSICLLFILVLCAPTIALAIGPYIVTDLGDLPGGNRNNNYAFAINSEGQVVGFDDDRSGQRAFVWTPSTPNGTVGSMVEIGLADPLGRATSNFVRAINSYGHIVGSNSAASEQNAFLWTPTTTNGTTGSAVDIGDLPGGGDNSSAQGINSQGQIVGSGSPATGLSRAFLWTPQTPNGATGSMIDLGDLPGGLDYSLAFDINSRGQTVGRSSAAPENDRAFLWTPTTPNGATGSMIDLGDLPGGANSSNAWAINSQGQVVGYSDQNSDGVHAFLWTPDAPNGTTGSMIDLGDLPGGRDSSAAQGINSLGHVVGISLNAIGSRAFLWLPNTPHGTTGVMHDLNTLREPVSGTGWTFQDAWGINDSGQIVGYGIFGSNVRAFLLTPVPEPMSLFLGVMGIVGCAAIGRKRRSMVGGG